MNYDGGDPTEPEDVDVDAVDALKDALTKAELLERAEADGVEVKSSANKTEIAEAIVEVEVHATGVSDIEDIDELGGFDEDGVYVSPNAYPDEDPDGVVTDEDGLDAEVVSDDEQDLRAVFGRTLVEREQYRQALDASLTATERAQRALGREFTPPEPRIEASPRP